MIDYIVSQITVDHMLALYLGLCIGIGLIWIAICGYEDVRMYREPWRRNASKFGYNYKCGLSWTMLFVFSCPVVNLVIIGAVTLSKLREMLEKENANSV